MVGCFFWCGKCNIFLFQYIFVPMGRCRIGPLLCFRCCRGRNPATVGVILLKLLRKDLNAGVEEVFRACDHPDGVGSEGG